MPNSPTATDWVSIAIPLVDYVIPIGNPANEATGFNTTPQSSSCLLLEIREIKSVHGYLKPDMEIGDLALGEREQPNSSEAQAFEEARHVLLVARPTVEGFGDHELKLAGHRARGEGLNAWAKQVGSGHGRVGIDFRQRPVTAFDEFSA